MKKEINPAVFWGVAAVLTVAILGGVYAFSSNQDAPMKNASPPTINQAPAPPPPAPPGGFGG